MGARGTRWFPGIRLRRPSLVDGWVLADGSVWGLGSSGWIDLLSLSLEPLGTLELAFRTEPDSRWLLRFSEVTDVQIDGAFVAGEAEHGWEVFELSMLVAPQPRSDGRLVYFASMPSATICFAGNAGVIVEL